MTLDPTKVKDNKPLCPHCKKEHTIRDEQKDGDPVGSGSTLGRRLKRTKSPHHYVIKVNAQNPGKFRYIGSLQAHHLVLSSTCNEDTNLANAVKKYGYDINHKKNGELLPGIMALACHLRKPVHNTNHDGGEAVADSTNVYTCYTTVVLQRAIEIINQYQNSDVCKFDDGLISDLNGFSAEVRRKVLSFVWTISEDGRDYNSAVGCGGANSLEEKRSMKADNNNIPTVCPHPGRNHSPITEKLLEIAAKLGEN